MKLEIFFDYECPFCLKGHGYLFELLPEFPQIEIVWQPCEAHPRPEEHPNHSDLLIMGMFYAAETGADLLAYQKRAYDLVHKLHVNIEDIDVVCENFADLLDTEQLREVLESGKFREKLQKANDYAYEQSGVWFLPAYRMNGQKLDSEGGIGVSKEQVQKFLEITNIILRIANQEDAVYLHKYRSESGENVTVAQIKAELASGQQGLVAGKQFMIEYNGAVIGDIHYGEIERNAAEIGVYIRDETFRGKGFGTCAVMNLAEKLFEKGYDAIVLNTAVGNSAMRNIAEKKLKLIPEIVANAYQEQSGTYESYAHYVWSRTI